MSTFFYLRQRSWWSFS